jgi:hypothetical protein
VSRPYLLYIPDIDGIGATSKQQWGELAGAFDFYMLKLLPADRSSFEQITAVAVVSGCVCGGGGGGLFNRAKRATSMRGRWIVCLL